MGNTETKRRRYQSFKEPRASADRSDILKTRQNTITDDYDLLTKNPKILGSGINGKVLLCQHKITKKKFDLKVISNL